MKLDASTLRALGFRSLGPEIAKAQSLRMSKTTVSERLSRKSGHVSLVVRHSDGQGAGFKQVERIASKVAELRGELAKCSSPSRAAKLTDLLDRYEQRIKELLP